MLYKPCRTAVAVFVAFTVNAFAAEDSQQKPDLKLRDEVVEFLTRNVIGRTVDRTNPRKEDSDFSQSWTWKNLKVTDLGFTYEEEVKIKQTRYELDADGKRTGTGTNMDRNYNTRIEISQREGFELLMGIRYFTASSFHDSTGLGYAIDVVKLENDKLVMEFTDANPTSWPKHPKEGIGYDLMKSKHVETLWLDDKGKLQRIFTQDTSFLDPKTRDVLKTESSKTEQSEQ